jgi:NADPH-dependent ferric siderophore reductase
MPRSPAKLGDVVQSVFGRAGQVLSTEDVAASLIELQLRVTPPPGGWQPGHEVQFRVSPTLGRRYNVRTVSAPSSDGHPADLVRLLVATRAAGPGTEWVRQLRVGADITVIAGRHKPLRHQGTRCLYLGDTSTIATIDAYATARRQSTVFLEVEPHAVSVLADRWPCYQFLPAGSKPGEALQDWLEHAIATKKLPDIDCAVLLGHAQSIQRQRSALIESQVLDRRSITTRPYWADGKAGL